MELEKKKLTRKEKIDKYQVKPIVVGIFIAGIIAWPPDYSDENYEYQTQIIKTNSAMKIKEQKFKSETASEYLPKIAIVDVENQKLNQEMQSLTAQNKELDIQLQSRAESEAKAKAKAESEAKAKAKADEEARKQAEAQAKADEEARKQAEAQAKADEEARKQAESQAESEVVPPEQSTEKFANCTELRGVYPDGVPAGHPAYQSKMDRDGDSWACE